MLEIERDLKIWTDRKWLGIVLFIFILQLGILFTASRPVIPRTVYSREPKMVLRSGLFPKPLAEWVRLEDPMLFAGANANGFSESAWLEREPLPSAEEGPLAPPEFAAFTIRSIPPPPDTQLIALRNADAYRPAPFYHEPAGVPKAPVGRSTVEANGFPGLNYLGNLKPPVQYFNDAVRSSVVEVVADGEGAIISARLLTSSGSKSADNDAVREARQAQFEPVAAPNEEPARRIVTGKLIFDWFALDSSRTNNVGQ